jgi:hypothetical protein
VTRRRAARQAALPLESEYPGDGPRKLFQFDRLGHVIVPAGLDVGFPVFNRGVRSHGNDRNVGDGVAQRVDLTCGGQAVQVGYLGVHADEVEAACREHREHDVLVHLVVLRHQDMQSALDHGDRTVEAGVGAQYRRRRGALGCLRGRCLGACTRLAACANGR